MTTAKRPSFIARQSTARIGLLALGLIALTLIIAAIPTIMFVRSFTADTMEPVAYFESGEAFEFVDENPYSDYLLSMDVPVRDGPLPEMEISVTNSDGEIETQSMNVWISMMGREYKQFLRIPKQPDGKLTIRIDTQENEDFMIFRHIGDVAQNATSRSLPLWILALVPLAGVLCCFGIMLVRAINASSKIEMHVSS
ncbi:MAG: hypothetical protein JJ974_07045 [Phycisphaerales bacterium]|nr:hypothetical protein [Phycisphaerales bacterium]